MSKKKHLFKSVTIILRPHAFAEFANILPNLLRWLNKRNLGVKFLEKEKMLVAKIHKSTPSYVSFIDEKDLHHVSELIVTLGGDGTFIGAVRHVGKKSPPVLGINMGKLGFITEFSRAELFDVLNEVLEGRYKTEKINLFRAEIFNSKENSTQSFFLNDVVINKFDISRMFRLSIEVDQEHVYDFSGDGLIVSSPVGSTAYSLAAGGPIINPKVNAMVITPVCPHGLTHRPLVISDKSHIKVEVPKESGPVTLTLDGQEAIGLSSKSIISIKKALNRGVKIVKNPSRAYFHTLALKFSHGLK